MNGMFAAAEPLRCVMDDGGRRDLHLRRKEAVAGAQAARPEDMARCKRPSFSPDDDEQEAGDRDGDQGSDHPWRLEVELSVHVRRDAKLAASRTQAARHAFMPHRAPGSTGKTRQQYLSGKPI